MRLLRRPPRAASDLEQLRARIAQARATVRELTTRADQEWR